MSVSYVNYPYVGAYVEMEGGPVPVHPGGFSDINNRHSDGRHSNSRHDVHHGNRASHKESRSAQKYQKRAKKAGKKAKKGGEDKETTENGTQGQEGAVEAPSDGGLSAWSVCAGSAVLNAANSAIQVTLHQSVPSINQDFATLPSPVNTTLAPTPATTPPGVDPCYFAMQNYVNTTPVNPDTQTVISRVQSCLNDAAWQSCMRFTFEITSQLPQPLVEPCSSLFLPQTGRLTAGRTFHASKVTTSSEDVGIIMDLIFTNVSLFAVLLAAILSIFTGNRVVSLTGSVLLAASFLATSFVSTEQDQLAEFLVGCIGGIGSAFLRLAAIVAILECFDQLRMRAIVIAGLGAVLVNFLTIGLSFIDGLDYYWRDTFKFQLIPAGLSLIAGIFMKPFEMLKRRRRRGNRERRSKGDKCSKNIFSRELYTNYILYLVLLIYLLDQLGRPIFSDSMEPLMEERNFTQLQIDLQPIIENGGALLGLLVLLFWKKHTLSDILAVMAALNLLIGLLAMQSPQLDTYTWVVVYSVIYGFTDGVFASVLVDAIPDTFGRQHIRIVAGLLGFVAGVGTVVAAWSADALNDRVGNISGSMYLAGSCLLASGLLAFISRFPAKRKEAENDDDDDTDDSDNGNIDRI